MWVSAGLLVGSSVLVAYYKTAGASREEEIVIARCVFVLLGVMVFACTAAHAIAEGNAPVRSLARLA